LKLKNYIITSSSKPRSHFVRLIKELKS